MKMGTGSSAKNKPSKWPLSDVLSFLDAPSNEREGLSNLSTDLNDSRHSEDDISHSTSIPHVIQDVQEEEYTEQEESEETTFKPKKIKLPPTKSASKKVKQNDSLVELLNKGNNERKKIMEHIFNADSEDPIDVFFKSMALTVKHFSPALKVKAKMDILRIVSELEMENNQQTKEIKNQNSVYVDSSCSTRASSQSLQSGISTYNYSTTSNSLEAENGSVEERLTFKHSLNQHREHSSNIYNNLQALTYYDQSQSNEYNV
ncbi:unnamed protein product [Macrosiphum euphorbiae]|nr:unnamed protein product [Macrosiphum euphorbiae]